MGFESTYLLVAQVDPIVMSEYSTVVDIFFDLGQFLGAKGSFGASNPTRRCSPVFSRCRGWENLVVDVVIVNSGNSMLWDRRLAERQSVLDQCKSCSAMRLLCEN